MKALSRISGERINATSCEGDTPLTVGDFMAQYASFVFRPVRAAFQALECTGSGSLECQLSFGLAKDMEGGARILKFTYNENEKSVATSSLQCLDVP